MMTLRIGRKTNHRFLGQSGGFTLIELLAVITIIGLLALLGVTTFSKFGSNIRLKSAADQIASTLRLARDLAVTQNKTIRATIYPRRASPPNCIVLTDSGVQIDKPWIASPLIEIADINGSSSSTTIDIDFSPYGTASSNSIHIIQKGTLISGSAYSPSGSYTSANKSERVKCYTLTTDNNTARTQIYAYGRNAPWDTDDLSASPP